MLRRAFLRCIPAFCLGAAAPAAVAKEPDGLVVNGRNFCRSFQQNAIGEWLEVQPGSIVPGRPVVMIGLNDGRLWSARKFDAKTTGAFVNGDWQVEIGWPETNLV